MSLAASNKEKKLWNKGIWVTRGGICWGEGRGLTSKHSTIRINCKFWRRRKKMKRPRVTNVKTAKLGQWGVFSCWLLVVTKTCLINCFWTSIQLNTTLYSYSSLNKDKGDQSEKKWGWCVLFKFYVSAAIANSTRSVPSAFSLCCEKRWTLPTQRSDCASLGMRASQWVRGWLHFVIGLEMGRSGRSQPFWPSRPALRNAQTQGLC